MTKPIQLNPEYQVTRPATQARSQPAGSQNFAEVLHQAKELKFSSHAQKRLQERSIALSGDGLASLAKAVDKVDKRGGRESLVLLDGMAFIVNVKERTVVTALDVNSRREGVFTQIDSVVLADPEMGSI